MRLLGCVGEDDLADQALDGPRRAGVDLAGVRRAPGPSGLSTILVTPDGDKTIVLALIANEAWAQEGERVADEVSQAPPGSVLVVDLEVPASLVDRAVRTARGHGLVVVLDPAPAERLPDHLLRLVDHVTPDHGEAHGLTGIDAASPEGALRAAEALRQQGAGAAYVKLSTGGCAVACEEGTCILHAPPDLSHRTAWSHPSTSFVPRRSCLSGRPSASALRWRQSLGAASWPSPNPVLDRKKGVSRRESPSRSGAPIQSR